MDKAIVIEGNRRESRRVLKFIKDSLADCEIFTFDENDHYNHVSQVISEISCFGQKRLIILNALPKITIERKKGSKKLSITEKRALERTKVLNNFKKFFPLIPEGNIVVFYNVGVSAESFFKEVRKCGKVKQFDIKLKKYDAKKIVFEYFREKKIEIEDEAATILIDSLNPNGADVDVDQINLRLMKMYNYVYGQKAVSKKDVYTVCSSSKEFVVWSLYNFLDAKDHCSSIRLIEDYLGSVRYFEQEAILLLSGMAWRYGLLLMVKSAIDKSISSEDIVKNLSKLNKLESKGKAQKITLKAKMKKDEPIPQYSEKMIYSVAERRFGKLIANCYNSDELLLSFYVIVKTLIKIRSGCTEAEVKMAIKIIVLVICGKIRKKNTIDGILEHRKMKYGIFK